CGWSRRSHCGRAPDHPRARRRRRLLDDGVAVPAMTALALAAVLSLAIDPHCGAAAPRSEFAQRITAIAIHESGGDPLVIGVNADQSRGLPAVVMRSATAQDAARQARMLLAQGRSIDLGLMQINSSQLARHG